MVKLTIDGKEVTVSTGTSIMEAARTNGIDIPGFCYHPRLDSFGACRVCMVHVTERGRTKDKFACAQPVSEGMEVVTKSELITKYVKSVTEYLLVHHPLDCPVCDKSGECELQDVTYKYKLDKGRIHTNRNDNPSVKNNPVLEFNHNRCILCGRCTRICGEVQGVAAIDFQGRGFTAEIGAPAGTDLDCEFCGQCLSVCPVGAIQDRTFNFQARPWELGKAKTTCTYCSVGCSVTLNTKNNKVVRVTANDEDGINGGNLCSKGRFGHEFINSGDRVLNPLVKKDGKLVPVSWDEALETVSSKLKEIKETSGAESIGGIGSEKCTNEDNYLFQKFFRTIVGSNSIDNMSNIRAPYLNEMILESVASGVGDETLDKLSEADMVFLFASNVIEEYPVVGNIIRKTIKKNKASLVIANTRKIKFKSEVKSGLSLTYKFGGEIALINALLKVLLEQDSLDGAKLDQYVNNSSEFKAFLENSDLDELLNSASVSRADLEVIVDCFLSSKKRYIVVGKEILNYPWAEESLRSIMNLALLTTYGISSVEDAGTTKIFFPREHNNSQGVNDMGVVPGFYPGYQNSSDKDIREKISKQLSSDLPENTLSKNGNLFDHAIQGKLKALYIMGDNPVLTHVDGREVREAINKLDFVVLQDSFLTETAFMADVVLPSSTFAEKDGSFVNLGRSIQKVVKAIEPLGESKPDFKIVCDVANKMGASFDYPNSKTILDEINENIPLYNNINYSELDNVGITWHDNLSYKCSSELQIVKTSKFEDDNVAKQFPLFLTTGNVMFHLGTYSYKSKVLNEIYSDCRAEINPEDAKEYNVFDGDKVEIISPNSELKLKVKVTKTSPKGIVFIPSSYDGVPVNILVDKNSVPRVKLIKI